MAMNEPELVEVHVCGGHKFVDVAFVRTFLQTAAVAVEPVDAGDPIHVAAAAGVHAAFAGALRAWDDLVASMTAMTN